MTAEQAEYEAKLAQREERERTTGHRPGGRPPTPPIEGPRDGDQYHFSDPESRIMKSSTHAGFEQDYDAQVAIDQVSLFIVGYALSNHPTRVRKPNPPLRLFPRKLAPPKRRHPTQATSVLPH